MKGAKCMLWGCITTYVDDEQDSPESKAMVGQHLWYRHTIDQIAVALGIMVFAVALGMLNLVLEESKYIS